MGGLTDATTSTGICALTVLPSSSVTLTAIEPAGPCAVPSAADTDSDAPDRDAEIPLGAESIE